MIVVDASPIVALLRCEPCAEGLADDLHGAAISTVNYSEIVSRMVDIGIDESIWRAGLATLRLRIEPFDLALSEKAGMLRDATRHLGLSLGDRACLALGLKMKAPVLTADRIWAKLDLDLDIRLIR